MQKVNTCLICFGIVSVEIHGARFFLLVLSLCKVLYHVADLRTGYVLQETICQICFQCGGSTETSWQIFMCFVCGPVRPLPSWQPAWHGNTMLLSRGLHDSDYVSEPGCDSWSSLWLIRQALLHAVHGQYKAVLNCITLLACSDS
jgi:hypothetical protein